MALNVERRIPSWNLGLKTAGGVAGAANMASNPKHKRRQDDGDADRRKSVDKALDDALTNTFPASDPISIEQPASREPDLEDKP